MKFKARKLLSLFAFLAVNSSSQVSAVQINPVYSLGGALATGAYAYATRYLSKKAAGEHMKTLAPTVEEFNKLAFNSTSSQMIIHPGHPVLAQIDMSIVLWTAFKVLLGTRYYGEDYLAAQSKIAAQIAGFDLAYTAGMDTLCVAEDIQAAYDIYEKYYTKEQLAQEPYALVTHSGSFLAGGLVGWKSFALGLFIGLKLTKDLELISFSPTFNKLAVTSLLVSIIFNVGINLSSLSEKLLFELLERFEPFKKCGSCRELFRLGGSMSYWATDVIPGYKKLGQAVILHAKQAK